MLGHFLLLDKLTERSTVSVISPSVSSPAGNQRRDKNAAPKLVIFQGRNRASQYVVIVGSIGNRRTAVLETQCRRPKYAKSGSRALVHSDAPDAALDLCQKRPTPIGTLASKATPSFANQGVKSS